MHLHRLRFGRGERYRCGAHSALFAASCCLFQRFFGRLRFKATPVGIVQRVRQLCHNPEFSAWRKTREIKLVKPAHYIHNYIYNVYIELRFFSRDYTALSWLTGRERNCNEKIVNIYKKISLFTVK